MRERYLGLVATIAASAMFACSDAAVEDVTAPPLAATPAAPVANQWPTVAEAEAAGIPSAIGIQIIVTSRFEDGFKDFASEARILFQWANEVSATHTSSLIDKTGKTINQGLTGVSYRRLALPVASGDTTIKLKISTNNITCGLLGKASATGSATFMALNAHMLQVSLFHQATTESAPDALQPSCPPPPPPPGCESEPSTRVISGTTGILVSEAADCNAPAPPNGGGNGDDYIEVCLIVWRELWVFNYIMQRYVMQSMWPIGQLCYLMNQQAT